MKFKIVKQTAHNKYFGKSYWKMISIDKHGHIVTLNGTWITRIEAVEALQNQIAKHKSKIDEDKKVIRVYLRGGNVEIENPTEVEVELWDFDIDATLTNEEIEQRQRGGEVKREEDGDRYALTHW